MATGRERREGAAVKERLSLFVLKSLRDAERRRKGAVKEGQNVEECRRDEKPAASVSLTTGRHVPATAARRPRRFFIAKYRSRSSRNVFIVSVFIQHLSITSDQLGFYRTLLVGLSILLLLLCSE